MNKVYIDGVFDLFHEGHIKLLERASELGFVIVGVHSDEYAASYKRRPIISELTRYKVVESCRYVDQVIKGVGELTLDMIDVYGITLVLHGDDFTEENVRKHYQPALDRNIFQFMPYTQNVSSTKIINDIESRFNQIDKD